MPYKRTVDEHWESWAHQGQWPDDSDWRVWMIMAGRGFGKTRAGAEWVSARARTDARLRIALVGATHDDVCKVMVEGVSGLLAVARTQEAPAWSASKGELEFVSGAKAFVYSAEAAEKLRGPEHHIAWCDEIAKWKYATAAWDNLQLGLRLAEQPQTLVTTTPRPVEIIQRLITEPGVVVQGGSTNDNANLPNAFVEAIETLYSGTRLGRQEIAGELITDVEGALWSHDLIERARTASLPELTRVVIGVDPPASANGDACGIIVAGLGEDGRGYILADASVERPSPDQWAGAVSNAAAIWNADRIIAEANQGGDMVKSVLLAKNGNLAVRLVHASRGKVTRAEPVAMLYESGRVSHVGAFPKLEDELCGLKTGGEYCGPGRSPDRADAMVWAVSALMLGPTRIPKIR